MTESKSPLKPSSSSSQSTMPLPESSHAVDSPEYAALLDDLPLNPSTGLKSTRDKFELPKKREMGGEGEGLDSPCIYMAGNSLGLQPSSTKKLIAEELDVWGSRAVLGHFAHPHSRPWKDIDTHPSLLPTLASIVGASSTSEIAVTSTLTSNLHNLFVSFYRPEKDVKGKGRRKILMEGKAFPSDQYAVQSHIDLHNLDPSTDLIELSPRPNETTLRTEDILKVIEEQGDEIALVWFSGVQYYTGQLFDMEAITKVGKAKGCVVGFDLAHAVGNVELKLHEWGVDFAVWCHYKYLNSGPGAVGGLFVHSRHDNDPSIPRLSGWWGHNPSTRFTMPREFSPTLGAQSFQHSNPPLLSLLPLFSSLEVFALAGVLNDNKGSPMSPLVHRSRLLTGYLEKLLRQSKWMRKAGENGEGVGFRILTGKEGERGAQLSLDVRGRRGEEGGMKRVFGGLVERGVMGDEREPNVIRLAPIPLYTTFDEVRLVAKYLDEALEDEAKGSASSGREEENKGAGATQTS